jgi:hypothetical protein
MPLALADGGRVAPVKLTFLGTRGELDVRTRRHRMHSSLAVSYHGCEIMIDCGLDWLRRIHRMRPQAIVLTLRNCTGSFESSRWLRLYVDPVGFQPGQLGTGFCWMPQWRIYPRLRKSLWSCKPSSMRG